MITWVLGPAELVKISTLFREQDSLFVLRFLLLENPHEEKILQTVLSLHDRLHSWVEA